MIRFANCKINLGLNIIEKRTDGFHNIETMFYPVPMNDILEVVPAEELSFQSSGIEIPGSSDDNLVMKAYHLLAKDFDLPPVSVHLHKMIPAGAGLGGGSSDASNMILMLNNQFELGMDADTMMDYARQLGSDCSFFINNDPVFAYDKGDVFEDVELDLKGYKIIIVKPEVHISSADAYGGVKPLKPENSLKELIKLPVEQWKDKIENDFEKTVFPKHPEIKDIKEQLYLHGATYASMSGSGAAVFGLFKNEIPDLNFGSYFVWKGEL